MKQRKLFKSIINVLAIIMCSACALCFSACGGSEDYQLTSDGSGYILKSVNEKKTADYVIPDTYKDKPVVEIESNAFYGCEGINTLTIPKSVTKIGGWLFSSSDKLNPLTKIIYKGTLEEWIAIDFEASIFTESSDFYLNDTKVTEITLNDENVDGNTFSNCPSITKITLGDSVKTVEDYAFSSCENLTDVVIGNNIEVLSKGLFYGCEKLENVTIGSGVKESKESSFQNCIGIKKVDFKGTIDQWAMIAFEKQETSWTVGSDYVNHVISNPIYYTSKLYINGAEVTEVNLTTATKVGKYAFTGCSSIATVNIGNSVEEIEEYAFVECEGLTNLTFGSGLTFIDYCAFNKCTGLTAITIPGNVNRIGAYAFEGCTNLANVYFNSPYGWELPTEYRYILEEDLRDSAKAAEYLVSNSYYSEKVWAKEVNN